MSTIYLVSAENKLTEMSASPFQTEADFQRLLADHPTLLRLAAGTAERLLLVSQEYGVMDDEGAGDRWSIDHLFLTREAVPVLVEVKRSGDTRGRREVVAQMLDYASHGSAYWSGSRMAERFNKTCVERGLHPEEILADFLEGKDPEAYWKTVESSLRAGRLRLVFVSDKIGKELQRIVEWLNEQLRVTEVVAIEVAQFVGPTGERTLVPRLIGQTTRAQSAKQIMEGSSPASVKEWIVAYKDLHGEEIASALQSFLDHAEAIGATLRLPSSGKSLMIDVESKTGVRGIVYVGKAKPDFQIGISAIAQAAAFSSADSLASVWEQITAITPSARAGSDIDKGWPVIPVRMLLDSGNANRARALMTQLVSGVRAG